MRPRVPVLVLVLTLSMSCESSEPSAEDQAVAAAKKNAVDGVPFDDVVHLEAGLNETCVIVASGALYCAGGTRAAYDSKILMARPIEGAAHTTQVSIGESTCAVQKDGSLLCWGESRNEVLPKKGPGKLFNPVEIPGLPPVSHTLATVAAFPYWAFSRDEGAAWHWGGTTFATSFVAPTKVEGLTLEDPVQLVSSKNFYCARLRAGGITCWDLRGYVDEGLSLSVKEQPSFLPTKAVDLAVQYRSLDAPQVACVLDEEGEAVCWRYTGKSLTHPEPFEHPFAGTRRWKDIALDAEHGCGVQDDGTVWCVGRNRDGQLGVAQPAEAASLLEVPGVVGAQAVAVGSDHSCALLNDRSVMCWGSNHDGQSGAPEGRTRKLAPGPFLRFVGKTGGP